MHKPEKISVDSKDIRIIKALYQTIANTVRISVAYSIDGLENVIARLKEDDLTQFAVVNIIKEQENLAIVNDVRILQNLQKDSLDVLNELLIIAETENLCAGLDRSKHIVRKFCLSSKTIDGMKRAIDFLIGPVEISIGKDINKEDVLVLVNIAAILNNPIRDLKSLLPITFDRNGKAKDFPDSTFGGLFPNGDFLDKVDLLVPQGNSTRKVKLNSEIRSINIKINDNNINL